ncbi:MAG TPA: antibiotic biosynthesis monooxygenase family protein [Ktedonobacteraceae bacterium]|jgi:heme-degrading monooxygenase HmoA|nr:antibiotic biosynthesis monooxygenase family protein [Ktedonobacteraceae bacterium]
MYGTIARYRLKPGAEAQLEEQFRIFQAAKVPGFVGTYVYRMDANAREYYLAVLFTNKEAYMANAKSPEQDARYRQMLQLLEEEPEWHDGEVVYVERPLA